MSYDYQPEGIETLTRNMWLDQLHRNSRRYIERNVGHEENAQRYIDLRALQMQVRG